MFFFVLSNVLKPYRLRNDNARSLNIFIYPAPDGCGIELECHVISMDLVFFFRFTNEIDAYIYTNDTALCI